MLFACIYINLEKVVIYTNNANNIKINAFTEIEKYIRMSLPFNLRTNLDK